MTTVTFVLHRGGTSETTATALALADRLLTRGHRVAVFAHDEAAELTVHGAPAAPVVAALVRRGLHAGTLDWVVEGEPDLEGGPRHHRPWRQVAGVAPGDHADLWALVRAADVVLTPNSGG